MDFAIAKNTLKQLNKTDISLNTILADYFNCSLAELACKNTMLEADFEKIKTVIQRLNNGEPLQYILGETCFFGYKFKVNKNVLIPRFDTEVLVQSVVNIAKGRNLKILDLCCGSGCIGITTKLQCKNCFVTLTDVSQGALDVAVTNAHMHNAEVEIIKSDLFSNLQGRKFDIIVSNPPYISTGEVAKLDKNVKDFEPHLALDGGTDGLDFYKKIIGEASSYLNVNGVLIFEIGFDQGEQVSRLMKENNFKDVKTIKDLDGKDRVVIGVKNNG